ncbi:MAG: VWA domain-containing protein [Rhodocyclaceae bacterium]|nr:VWA domain-containing protein [Rhodocyclaceae bacterium]
MDARPAAAADPLARVLAFGRHLRANGVPVGIPEQQLLLDMLLACPPPQHTLVKCGWRAAVCRDHRQWRRFEELFDAFWRPGRITGRVRRVGRPGAGRDLPQLVSELRHDTGDEDATPAGSSAAATRPEPGEPVAEGGASRGEALLDRPVDSWSGDDQAQFEQLARRLERRLRRQLLRRQRVDPSSGQLDVRATLRASLATGGLPLAPTWRRPRSTARAPLVLIDVSRSMEARAALYLRLARVLAEVLGARVYVFHTHLLSVGELLRRTGQRAGERLKAATAGFGSGTRIAGCLEQLLATARGQVGRARTLLLFSDGYDSDPPEQLAVQLTRLRARGTRIVWLHPGAGPPESRAVAGCVGLIDRFVRADNVASLQRLAEVLP